MRRASSDISASGSLLIQLGDDSVRGNGPETIVKPEPPPVELSATEKPVPELRDLTKSTPSHSPSPNVVLDGIVTLPQVNSSRTLPRPSTPIIPTLRKSSSHVRLSLSFDGRAGVSLDDEEERIQLPQLVEPQHRQNSSLRRSLSDMPGRFETASLSLGQSTTPPPWMSRQGSGRSREARTWEFYCDADARKALTDKIESANDGSAVDALGLLRVRSSNIQSSQPQQSLSKRGLKSAFSDNNAKRLKVAQHQRSKLSRANSSFARLQSDDSGYFKKAQQPRNGSDRFSEWDENKENWSPDSQKGPANTQHRQLQRVKSLSHAPQQPSKLKALGDNSDLMTSFTQPLEPAKIPESQRSNRTDIYEDDTSATDEVSQEQGQDLPTPIKNRVAELDCVQNLLSLSQGCWR
jgi:hypothetical protein